MEMADEKRLMSDGDRCANSQNNLARTLVCGFWWINIGSLYLVAEINIGEWNKNIASVMFPTTQSLKKRRSHMTLLTH